MGKTSKKKKKQQQEKKRDLADRLRGLGLRKELAKRIADNAVDARGQIPGSARKKIKEIRAKVDDLGTGVFRATKGAAKQGKTAEDDVETAARQQRREQKKTSAKKKAKKVKKKLLKKAKRVRKAAKAKAEQAQQAKQAESGGTPPMETR